MEKPGQEMVNKKTEQERVIDEIMLHILAGFRFIYVNTVEEYEFSKRIKENIDNTDKFGKLSIFIEYDEITKTADVHGEHAENVLKKFNFKGDLIPHVFDFGEEIEGSVVIFDKQDMSTKERFRSFSHPASLALEERLDDLKNRFNLLDGPDFSTVFENTGDKVRFIFLINDAHLQFFIKTRSYKRIEEFFDKHGFKRGDWIFIFISSFPSSVLPSDFARYLVNFNYPLPGIETMKKILYHHVLLPGNKSLDEVNESLIESYAKAGVGLSEREFKLTLNLAMQEGGLNSNNLMTVHNQKAQMLKTSSQFLEYIPVSSSWSKGDEFKDIGGLNKLKDWIKLRKLLINPEEMKFEGPRKEMIDKLDKPKGLLLFGVSGGGKSLMVKHIAMLFRIPLLRLDIGRIYGQYVGQSEMNIRETIRLAEAMSPCVLWIDEIEKGFAGAQGGTGDSGTSTRVFGTFLTWMQEKKKMVFVVATANNIKTIPKEMTRMGRFDALFFVPLPDLNSIIDIFKIHVNKYIPFSILPDDEINALALEIFKTGVDSNKLKNITGAEIEQAVKNAILESISQRDDMNIKDCLKNAFNEIAPMYNNDSMIKLYEELCEFAKSSANFAGDYDKNDRVITKVFGRSK